MTKTIAMPDRPTENQIEAALHLIDKPPAEARRILRSIYSAFIDLRPEAEMPVNLTKKQAQLMELLIEHEAEKGHAPTQEDLASMVGCDRRLIIYRLKALERKGYLYLTRAHRGIHIRKKI